MSTVDVVPVIGGRTGIRDAYRDDRVARGYVDARFRDPLGALLHARQARAIRALIRAEGAARVLEIAPGPGRLTVEVCDAVRGQAIAVEASAQMIAEARRRLADAGRHVDLLQGDAFNLPFGAVFDLVYVFRLIRHFQAAERIELYRQIVRVLRPGGVLMFDAVNEAVSAPLRARASADEYQHYDALMRPEVLRSELAEAGLAVTSLEGVQHRYGALTRIRDLVAPRSRAAARLAIELTDRLGGGPPLEWIVTCRRG